MTLTKTLKMLFVDDSAAFRDNNVAKLTAEGFVVTEAESESQAMELVEKENFDIIVTDLVMDNPDSGFSLAYHIKKKNPNVPIIIVSTANSKFGLDFSVSSESERRWMKCDAMLPKPLRFEQLLAECQRLLGIEQPHNGHH
jgi:Response regulator containing CheY-like receiver, AAA-type ATPase, and DNA-binding domains